MKGQVFGVVGAIEAGGPDVEAADQAAHDRAGEDGVEVFAREVHVGVEEGELGHGRFSQGWSRFGGGHAFAFAGASA